jgi:hypothetical protein
MLYGYGVNALETDFRQIFVVGRSIEGDCFKSYPLVDPLKGHVRAHVEVVGATLKPLPDGKVDFKFVLNFDPKLKTVPYKLLNWVSRKF